MYLCGWEAGREEERMCESEGGEGGFAPLAVAIAGDDGQCEGFEARATRGVSGLASVT